MLQTWTQIGALCAANYCIRQRYWRCSISDPLHQWLIMTQLHYDGVIMGAMASQITSLTIVYSTVYSGADRRKHQSSASLAFVWGIHRGPVNSPYKWPVTRKMFPFDDVIMENFATNTSTSHQKCSRPYFQVLANKRLIHTKVAASRINLIAQVSLQRAKLSSMYRVYCMDYIWTNRKIKSKTLILWIEYNTMQAIL